MKRTILHTLALLTLGWLLQACTLSELRAPGRVRISGSDTMLLLTRRWAEEFMRTHPGVVVEVSGGGTRHGVEQLIAGKVDLAAGSRPLLAEEVQRLTAEHGTLGVSFRCGRDAVSVYVHPENPVRALGLLQLKGLFTGRIGVWRKVGGRDEAVRVLVRSPTSGTRKLFQDLVLDEEPYSSRAETLPTTAAVVASVASDRAAVGYGGMAYGSELVHCAINGVRPSTETVRSGAYPLSRYLYLHAVRPPEGWTSRFVDWVLTSAGQQIVSEVGYVSLWDVPTSG